MKTILNKTRKPLSIPLPSGKRLFLGPGKTGQIASKAADHPPLIALVEAGDLEVLGEGSSFTGQDESAGPTIPSSEGHKSGKALFRRRDV